MTKRSSTRSKTARQPSRSRASVPTRSPGSPEKHSAASATEQTIIEMAETMGRLVGEGEVRWKQWVSQPHAVRDSLMTIRDKATRLLLEMRTSAELGFAKARDQADDEGVRVDAAPPVAKRKPARPVR